ncbi:TetR/AcrR family transcriptional regulator [Robertmurraya siralis]|nr:TetR/AcrR family transcriptional regulator [Robertmurraya siralis]
MMKEKIMKESIDLFDKKGFSDTSIQDIVDLIGVTKGTFYYYFKSKQELLRDIHLSYLERLLMEQKKILQDESKNYKEKLLAIIHLTVSKIKDEGKMARIVFREMRHLNEDNLNQIKMKRKEFRLNFQQILEEGVQQGEFNETIRTDILSFAILGMVNRSYYWFNPDGEISAEELSDLYLKLILEGIDRRS